MKETALHVLLVEDNAGDARLLREMFSTGKPGSFELTHLLRMSEAVIHLAKGGVDVVLLDVELPDAHGLDTVPQAHALAPSVPLRWLEPYARSPRERHSNGAGLSAF
jgi:CheY-like chemotaxis protein